MSRKTNPPAAPEPAEQPPVDQQAGSDELRQHVALSYAAGSGLEQGDSTDALALSSNLLRAPVQFRGRVRAPLHVRECLAALYAVVAGDFSYKPKDRSAYLAFQAMKKQTAGAAAWEARQAYLDWAARNDPDAWLLLDPVVSVYPDRLTFEVFSKDEGAYALASIDMAAFEPEGEPVCGTTNVDYSQDLAQAIERLRSYHETRLAIGREAVTVATVAGETTHTHLEKQIQLPASWLRGFLQVQSAGLLPHARFSLAPMDLYNLLRELRLNKDRKKGGRALRIELVPNELPRLVLEPWNLVLAASAGVYTGRRPEIVRLWGRRRLKVLERLLPLAESIEVHVLGSGLPAFFVLQAGPVSFTLALTGFSASNWSQSLAFDLIQPQSEDQSLLPAVLAQLQGMRPMSLSELATALAKPAAEVLAAVQSGCSQGQILYDLYGCRLRPLLDDPIPPDTLRFRNRRERRAHDLLARAGAVTLESEAHFYDSGEAGVELVGKVADPADKREHRPLLRLGADGRVLRAECSCAFYRAHQLKEGPCEHLIALRLHFGRLELERKAHPDREHVRLETRHYSKRHPDGGESVYRLVLAEKRLTKHWQLQGERERKQALVFNSVSEARDAYFTQIDSLEARGFIDARS